MFRLNILLRRLLPARPTGRTIAPGVTVQVQQVSDSFHLTDGPAVQRLMHRLCEAWDVLRGRAHAAANPTLDQRLGQPRG